MNAEQSVLECLEQAKQLDVNFKGAIGLNKVIQDLMHNGWHCYPAFSDYGAVDLIALSLVTGVTRRLQVKYRSPAAARHNAYEITARSVVNGKSIPIDRSMIDAWAVYLSDRDEVVYLPVEVMEGKSTHLICQSHLKEDYKHVVKLLDDGMLNAERELRILCEQN